METFSLTADDKICAITSHGTLACSWNYHKVAWLLFTWARLHTRFFVGKVVRARGHLPVPEAGLEHPGSVA